MLVNSSQPEGRQPDAWPWSPAARDTSEAEIGNPVVKGLGPLAEAVIEAWGEGAAAAGLGACSRDGAILAAAESLAPALDDWGCALIAWL